MLRRYAIRSGRRKISQRITPRVLRGVSQSRNFAAMGEVADPGDLLNVGQVASELNKPPRTVHHWIKTGRIAATKLGEARTNAYAITRAEVERVKAEIEPAA